MGYVNGCRTVNGGVIVDVGLARIKNVEVLSHKFHNPHCDIACYYYMDEQTGSKIEVTVCKDLEYKGHMNNGAYSSEVYFFHNKEDLQHYTSRRYELQDIPKKYVELVKDLYRAHLMIDFEQYEKRPKDENEVSITPKVQVLAETMLKTAADLVGANFKYIKRKDATNRKPGMTEIYGVDYKSESGKAEGVLEFLRRTDNMDLIYFNGKTENGLVEETYPLNKVGKDIIQKAINNYFKTVCSVKSGQSCVELIKQVESEAGKGKANIAKLDLEGNELEKLKFRIGAYIGVLVTYKSVNNQADALHLCVQKWGSNEIEINKFAPNNEMGRQSIVRELIEKVKSF